MEGDQELKQLRSVALKLVGKHVDYTSALLEAHRLGVEGSIQYASEEVTQSFVSLILDACSKSCREDLVLMFRKLENMGKIDHSFLVSSVCNSVGGLKLDLLLLFMQESIIPLSVLLESDVANAGLFESFQSSCYIISERSVVRGITELLIQEGFPDKHNSVGTERARDFLTSHISVCFENESCVYTALHAINESGRISSETVPKIHFHLLSKLLTLPPTTPVVNIVECQYEFTFQSLPQKTVTLFSLLCNCLQIRKFLSFLHSILTNQIGLNWKWILTCVACNINFTPVFKDLFYSFLGELVKAAICEGSQDLLIYCIVLARQFGVADTNQYKNWFKQTFGRSKSTGKKGVYFLIESLTRLVPYEPIECLKVHLDAFASRSEKLITDYISLIKTRLIDLGDCPVDRNNLEASVLVQQAIEEYSFSGHISHRVIEASIFRSPFYISCFLPLLLSDEKDSTRQALIMELSKQGRIPTKMYSDYHNKKSSQNGQLTANRDEDKLEAVTKGIQTVDDENLETFLETLKGVLSYGNVKQNTINYDLRTPALVSWQVEVVDRVIHVICQEVTDDHRAYSKWVSTILELFSNIGSIHWPLLVRLWELLTYQVTILSRAHLRGLACLTLQLAHSKSLSDQITLAAPTITLTTFKQWGELLVECLPLDSCKNMAATYQFATSYLLIHQHCEPNSSLKYNIADSILLAKFVYLKSRYTYMKSKILFSEVTEIQALVSMSDELSYDQWLKWEFHINPQDDFLLHYERMAYLIKTINHYLVTDGGGEKSIVNQLYMELLTPALPSYEHGILLLQETLGRCYHTWCKAPLVEAIDYALLHFIGDRLYERIIRVLCDLPAKYFFTCASELTGSADCLSSIQALSPESMVLPANFTFHITKVLGITSTIERFCLCSSLYYSSLLIALTECSVLPVDISSDIQKNVQWLLNLPSKDSACCLPDEVNAVCLFHRALGDQNLAASQCLKTATYNVVIGFFDCCVRVLAMNILHPPNQLTERILTLIKESLLLKPLLVSIAQFDLQVSEYKEFLCQLRNCFPCHNAKLLPYVFFSVVSNIPDAILERLCKSESSLIQSCVSNHQQLMELQQASHLQCYKAFDVDFLKSCTEITKNILRNSPPKHLKKARPYSHWSMEYFFNNQSISSNSLESIDIEL